MSKVSVAAIITEPLPTKHIPAAIVAIVIGYFAAMLTMPDDIVTAGALRIPSILFTFGLLFGIVSRLQTSGFEAVLYPECAVTVAVCFFILLDTIQGIYPLEDISRDGVRGVFLGIALFMVVMLATTAQKPWKLPQAILRTATLRYSPKFLQRALWICFFMGMFYFAFMSRFSPTIMLRGLTHGRFSAPWSRSSMGGWYAFLDHMVYFGYLLSPLTVLIGLVEGKWLTKRVMLGVILCLLFLPFVMQGGGRRVFAMCIGSGVFTWICAERKRIRPRHLVALTVLAGVGLVVMDMMLANRNTGAMQFTYSLDQFQYVRVDDNFLRFGQMLDMIPKEFPFTRFKWLAWILARPIPRVLWPSKPMNPGFDLAESLGVTASLSCSSIAEWYGAFGWFGIAFAGYLYGRLSTWWGQLIRMRLPVTSIGVYSLGLMALIISVRSMIELVLMSYPLLVIILLSRMGRKNAMKPAQQPVRVYRPAQPVLKPYSPTSYRLRP